MKRAFIIFAALNVAFFNYGVLQAYGALFTATLEKYGEGRSKTSLIHSLLAGTTLGGGVIAGYLIKRFNLTVVSTIGSVLLPLGFMVSYFATSVMFLLISIGVVSGLGISFTYVSAVVVLGRVISEKHKTSALSLQNVACGVPGIVLPYLYAWLSNTFTLSGTFLIYGGILLNNLAASILFNGVKIETPGHNDLNQEDTVIYTVDSQSMSRSQDISTENNECAAEREQNSEGAEHVKASQRISYILFLISMSIVISNVIGIQALYQDISVFKGLSTEQTLSCISAYSITSTLSRFFPIIFQIVSENPFLSPIVASVSGVLGQAILLMTSQYYTVLIGFVLTGLTDGGASVSISVVIYKILSQDTQTMGFGLVLTVVGIISTTSGPIYGAIFDRTESYTLVLSMTTGSFAVGSVLFVACFISYRNQGRI